MAARKPTTPPDAPDPDAPDTADLDTVSDDESDDALEEKYRARGWTRNDNGDLIDANGDEVPMIVHNARVADAAGVVHIVPHGPMPAIDWPDYEKRHNL